MNLTHALVAAGLSLAAVPATSFVLDDGKQATQKLIQQLGDKDYKTRKDAFRQLEKMGASARSALEQAEKSDDPETHWSASLLLDRLDNDDADDARGDDPKMGGDGRLKERHENSNDADQDDDAAPAPRSRHWRVLKTPDDFDQEMRELERRLDEFQKQFDQEFNRDAGRHGQWFHGGPFGLKLFDDFGQNGGGPPRLAPNSSFSRTTLDNGQKESLSIKVDEQGHVTAEQEKDGQTIKVEADSIEAFEKDHPELLKQLGNFSGIQFRFGPFGQRAQPTPPAANPDANAPELKPKHRTKVEKPAPKAKVEKPLEPTPAPENAAPANKPRLGVQVEPVSADVAAYLELDDGVGLEVIKVFDDTPAARRGLKKHDIITDVNGRTIKSVEDVAAALAGSDPETVSVTVIRRGQTRKL